MPTADAYYVAQLRYFFLFILIATIIPKSCLNDFSNNIFMTGTKMFSKWKRKILTDDVVYTEWKCQSYLLIFI